MYFKGSDEPSKTFAALLKWLVYAHYKYSIVILWLIAKTHKMSSIRISPSMPLHAYMLLDIFPLNYFYSMHIKSSARKNAKCVPKNISTRVAMQTKEIIRHLIKSTFYILWLLWAFKYSSFYQRTSTLSDSCNI